MTDKQDDMLLGRYHRANAYAAELEAERDALRAENEQLREDLELRARPTRDELDDEIARLEAENERLRNGDGLEYSLSLTNADLHAENERLRTALAEILTQSRRGDIIERGPLGDIALAALATPVALPRAPGTFRTPPSP